MLVELFWLLAPMFVVGIIFDPIVDMFKEDPELRRKRFALNEDLARYYENRAGELESEREADQAVAESALGRFSQLQPRIQEETDRDLDFMSGMRPGGKQEGRIDSIIARAFDKIDKASQIGLDRARADHKSRLARGGNSPFADSSFARRGEQLMHQNFSTNLAGQREQARLDNALRFLGAYRPGAAMNLGRQSSAFNMTPMQIRGSEMGLGQNRAGNVMQGLRGSYDDHYFWKRDKNWADWVQAVGDTIGNAASVGAGLFSGGMIGGGAGGAGGGMFGGFGGGGGIGGQPGGRQDQFNQQAIAAAGRKLGGIY